MRDRGTPEPPIDVSLTCTTAINPLEIRSGCTGYVISLNQGLLRSRGFYIIDNRNGNTPIYWPDPQRFKSSTIHGYRCDVKNHSQVNLARIVFDLQLRFGKEFPPHLPHKRSIEINHLDHSEEFTFYILNPCPVFVSMSFPHTAEARLAGRTEMRTFPLVHPEKHNYCFDPNLQNFMAESCI